MRIILFDLQLAQGYNSPQGILPVECFDFWIPLKMGTTPTPTPNHIISLYAKASIRDAENPGSKIADSGFLPVFERDSKHTHSSGKILYSSTWTASSSVSYFSFLQP